MDFAFSAALAQSHRAVDTRSDPFGIGSFLPLAGQVALGSNLLGSLNYYSPVLSGPALGTQPPEPANPYAAASLTFTTVAVRPDWSNSSQTLDVDQTGTDGWGTPPPAASYVPLTQSFPYAVNTVTTTWTWTPATQTIAAVWGFNMVGNAGDTTMGPTNYVGNAGMYFFNTDTTFGGDAAFSPGPYYPDSATALLQITDGSSNTIGFGEALGGPLTGPLPYQLTWLGTGVLPSYWDCQVPSQSFMFSSAHPGVVNFAFCDGSVRAITTIQASPADTAASPPANRGSTRWTAFQLIAGISDNVTANQALLGLE